jgi:hypothetical protein
MYRFDMNAKSRFKAVSLSSRRSTGVSAVGLQQVREF